MDFDAYGQAVVHLAWYRDDKSYHLVFGIVELHPSELPPALGCSMKSCRFRNKESKYLHYQRFAIPVADAIEWYEGAIGGHLVFPDEMRQVTAVDEARLYGGPFVQETALARTCLFKRTGLRSRLDAGSAGAFPVSQGGPFIGDRRGSHA